MVRLARRGRGGGTRPRARDPARARARAAGRRRARRPPRREHSPARGQPRPRALPRVERAALRRPHRGGARPDLDLRARAARAMLRSGGAAGHRPAARHRGRRSARPDAAGAGAGDRGRDPGGRGAGGGGHRRAERGSERRDHALARPVDRGPGRRRGGPSREGSRARALRAVLESHPGAAPARSRRRAHAPRGFGGPRAWAGPALGARDRGAGRLAGLPGRPRPPPCGRARGESHRRGGSGPGPGRRARAGARRLHPLVRPRARSRCARQRPARPAGLRRGPGARARWCPSTSPRRWRDSWRRRGRRACPP